jgi:hypothetical protein
MHHPTNNKATIVQTLRKLSIIGPIKHVFSFCQLFRMTCVVLSLVISSNLVALSFTRNTTASINIGITLAQNSAFSNSYKFHSCSRCVTRTRVGKLIQCIQISVISSVITVFHKESSSCFSQSRLLVSLNRCGIAVISPAPIACAVFGGATQLDVKRISPNGAFILRALIALTMAVA